VLHRRALLVGLGACAAVTAAAGASRAAAMQSREPPASAVPTYQRVERTSELRRLQPRALLEVPTSLPLVALTFDDGPDPRYTPDVLDALAEADATATFFLIGANALAYPSLVRQLLAEGHSVGNHTYAHLDLVPQAPAAVLEEIDRAEHAITLAGRVRPTLFRPPLASTSQAVGVLSDARRYTTVYWTTCLEKYADSGTASDVAQRVLDDVRPGSIILAHDGGHVVDSATRIDRTLTVAALPLVLSGLQRRGLRVVDVPRLVAAAQ